jgi:DNA-3-methyladenine glycosylase
MRPVAPWSDGAPHVGFPAALLERSVVEVAVGLLGARLVSTVGGVRTVGVIVETEAYGGPEDPASHAATVRGPTERNRAMYGPAGRAYIYRSHGVHWCMNVVTGVEGRAEAVLVRGVEALEGEESMTARRRGASPLGAGPGRLCAALAITGELYGHDLREPPLRLEAGWAIPDERVGVSGRVGVSVAGDWPHRFFVRGSTGVSRPEGWGAARRRRGSPMRARG